MWISWLVINKKKFCRCRRDRMVVGFKTTYTISAYHHWSCEFESHSGEVYLIQHYVIVCKWLATCRWFSPGPLAPSRTPIKLTATSLSPIRRGFAPGFVNYKKGALDSQPQMIKFTSCLPMVGGSLWVLRSGFFNH